MVQLFVKLSRAKMELCLKYRLYLRVFLPKLKKTEKLRFPNKNSCSSNNHFSGAFAVKLPGCIGLKSTQLVV